MEKILLILFCILSLNALHAQEGTDNNRDPTARKEFYWFAGGTVGQGEFPQGVGFYGNFRKGNHLLLGEAWYGYGESGMTAAYHRFVSRQWAVGVSTSSLTIDYPRFTRLSDIRGNAKLAYIPLDNRKWFLSLSALGGAYLDQYLDFSSGLFNPDDKVRILGNYGVETLFEVRGIVDFLNLRFGVEWENVHGLNGHAGIGFNF